MFEKHSDFCAFYILNYKQVIMLTKMFSCDSRDSQSFGISMYILYCITCTYLTKKPFITTICKTVGQLKRQDRLKKRPGRFKIRLSPFIVLFAK